MLEYFTFKKVKKHQAEKRAEAKVQTPILNEEDENFLERVISAEGPPPPLPDRPHGLGPEAGDSTGNNSQMVEHNGGPVDEKHKDKGKGKENEKPKDAKKSNRFSFLSRSGTKKDKKLSPNETVVTPAEASKEEDDINKVLDDLNLAAVNNRAFSISKESQELVQKFTVILKDLVNGVPTAYDDLVGLLNDSQGTLAKQYDHLPSFLQKLITQLPTKLTGSLAPELLAVATEAQALNLNASAATAGAGGGFAGAAKSFLKPNSLKDLVTKPGAVVSLLKAIMNALKLRWPAFMGTNVLLSLALFVLLFVFWYCHKRGRETRLEREKTVDSNGRIVDLDDDPMLGEAGPSRSTTRSRRSHTDREPEQGNSSGHDHAHADGHHSNLRPDAADDRPASSRTKSSEHRRPVGAEYAGDRRSGDRR